MTWDSFQGPPGGQGPYIEYGPYRPPQPPLPPYGASGGGWWTGAGGSTPFAPLPLGEAIKQLPTQYKKVPQPSSSDNSPFGFFIGLPLAVLGVLAVGGDK